MVGFLICTNYINQTEWTKLVVPPPTFQNLHANYAYAYFLTQTYKDSKMFNPRRMSDMFLHSRLCWAEKFPTIIEM